MRIIQTEIPGAVILETRVFTDGRGFFLESHNERGFALLGITERFVQDNQSRSKRGVLRGLHFQVEQPQGKLVQVIAESGGLEEGIGNAWKMAGRAAILCEPSDDLTPTRSRTGPFPKTSWSNVSSMPSQEMLSDLQNGELPCAVFVRRDSSGWFRSKKPRRLAERVDEREGRLGFFFLLTTLTIKWRPGAGFEPARPRGTEGACALASASALSPPRAVLLEQFAFQRPAPRAFAHPPQREGHPQETTSLRSVEACHEQSPFKICAIFHP